jgi:hypothetical protein
MSEIVHELLEFVNTREVTTHLKGVVQEFGNVDTRVLAISILAWLKRQKRAKSEAPLQLIPQYAWCRGLVKLTEQWPALGEIMEVADDKCNFKRTVSQRDRDEMRELADQGFRPPLMT